MKDKSIVIAWVAWAIALVVGGFLLFTATRHVTNQSPCASSYHRVDDDAVVSHCIHN